MTEQCLDDADVYAILEQVGGEAVPQSVRSHALGDVSCLGGLDDDPVKLAGADRQRRALTRKEPAIGVEHTLLPPRAPPVPQQQEQTFGQHGIAITSPFAALDPQQHALAVDIAHLERRYRANPQTRAIGKRTSNPAPGPARRTQLPRPPEPQKNAHPLPARETTSQARPSL